MRGATAERIARHTKGQAARALWAEWTNLKAWNASPWS